MKPEHQQKLNFPKNINPEVTKSILNISISLIIPILIYASILAIDLPEEIGSAARYGVSWLLAGFAILLYLAYRLPGHIGRMSSLSLTLVLFALPLARLWSNGVSEWLIVGGLLPWSDANGYYWDARRLLQGLPMVPSMYNARPLFVGFLSIILGLAQQNLQITIAISTALIAISCYLLTREIQKNYGTAAGVLVLLCLFIFISPFIGSLMTENFGLCCGVLSFALLLRGARKMSLNTTLIGLFVLTIGLNARTGTLFVLPALLLWGGYVFRGSKWFSRQFVLAGVSVILLGFILNSLLLKAIGNPGSGSTYSTFAFIFYGVITQTDWTQMLKDYPKMQQLLPFQVEQQAYSILWQTLREHPSASIQGIINEWRKFFFDEHFSIFFIQRNEMEMSLRVLGSIGLVTCLSKLTKPSASLIIMYALGVIASIPFVGGTSQFRIYAVTVIIFPLLSAIGLALILQKIIHPTLWFGWNLLEQRSLISYLNLAPFLSPSNTQKGSPTLSFWQDKGLLIFSLTLVMLSFIGPITIKQFSYTPQTAHTSCPDGLETQYFRNNPGSSINLVSDDAMTDSHLPNIRISDYRKGLTNFAYWQKESEAFAKLSPGLTILDTYNYEWLVAKSSLIPQERGFILACGTRETIGYLTFFHADYLEPISSQSKGQ